MNHSSDRKTGGMNEIASRLVEMAGKSGAIDADALAVNDVGENISVRNRKVESVEREDSRGNWSACLY